MDNDFNFPVVNFPFLRSNIPRHLHTGFMYLSLSIMLEPAGNIKTLLIERSCSPVNCCHRVIAKPSLCQQSQISTEDSMTSLIPTMWPFLCPRHKIAGGHIKFTLSARVCVRLYVPESCPTLNFIVHGGI